MMTCLFAIIAAEFKNIFFNKNVITVMLIGPLIYCFFYPQPYVKEVTANISIGVVDQDNSTLSRELIRNINATKTIKADIKFTSMQEAEKKLKSREISGILVIPLRFEQKVLRGESSPLSFYGDASYILIYNNEATTLSSVVTAMGKKISIERQINQGVDPAIAKSESGPFITNMVPLFNPQTGYATFLLPPVFILILHQLLFIGIVLTTFLARKKTELLFSTLPQQLSPLAQSLLFIVAKVITYVVIYFIVFTFFMIMLTCWYGIPILASYTDIVIFGLLFLIATTVFSIATSAFIRHVEDAFLLMVPISILLFFSTGLSWPKELIPSFITFITHLFPAIPSMLAFVKISEMGAPFSLILPEVYNLLALTFLYFFIALFLYYRYFNRLRQHHDSPKQL